MKRRSPAPRLEDAPDELLASGHLWLYEYVDGAHLRFRLDDSGVIRFGDRHRVFDPEEIPLHYGHAARRIRDRLDRDALRRAVPDVSSVTFFGVATCRRRIGYDWDRLPSFLGTDVWVASDETFLPPDTVEKIFRRLGLEPLPAVRKEVRAVDFDPDGFDGPASQWYDGPAAGVIVRNKRGARAKLLDPAVAGRDSAGASGPPPDSDGTGSAVDGRATVDEYVTEERVARAKRELEDLGWPVTADTLYEAVLETVGREAGPDAFGEGGSVDPASVREAVAARTRRFLDERE